MCAHLSCKNSKTAAPHWTTFEEECWIPPEIDAPCQRVKEKPQQDDRRGKLHWESNPLYTRHAKRAQATLVHNKSQRPHRVWTRSDFECLSVSCGGMGLQWPDAGAGALVAAELGHPACGISPLGGGPINPTKESPRWLPASCRKIITNEFTPVKKVLVLTTDFQTWGSGKGTENPQRIWFGGQWDLITELT